jgi:hypothetical protein
MFLIRFFFVGQAERSGKISLEVFTIEYLISSVIIIIDVHPFDGKWTTAEMEMFHSHDYSEMTMQSGIGNSQSHMEIINFMNEVCLFCRFYLNATCKFL